MKLINIADLHVSKQVGKPATFLHWENKAKLQKNNRKVNRDQKEQRFFCVMVGSLVFCLRSS